MKTRRLASVQHKLRDHRVLETAIEDALGRRSHVRVLEVGFGHGRALLELAWRFRNDPVRFYGVDQRRKLPVKHRRDLRRMARRFGIASPEAIDGLTLPRIRFYDATQLDFETASLDLVYSSVTVRFMRDKARFLEEVARVLRPGGRALLHVGEAGWDHAHQRAEPPPLLTRHLSRMVLLAGDEIVPLATWLRRASTRDLTLSLIGETSCVIRIAKHREATLDLGLALDEELTLPMDALPFDAILGYHTGRGTRSVYRVPPERLAEMKAAGVLGEPAPAPPPLDAASGEPPDYARCERCGAVHEVSALVRELGPGGLAGVREVLRKMVREAATRRSAPRTPGPEDPASGS